MRYSPLLSVLLGSSLLTITACASEPATAIRVDVPTKQGEPGMQESTAVPPTAVPPTAIPPTAVSPTPLKVGPGEVVVRGALSADYTIARTSVRILGDTPWIFVELFTKVGGGSFDHVRIRVPEGIGPGSYSISNGDSPMEIYAEFRALDKASAVTTYKGFTGSISISADANEYSGTFTFTASPSSDTSQNIEVVGSFEGVAAEKLGAEELPTVAAIKQTECPGADTEPGPHEIMITGAVCLRYPIGRTRVDEWEGEGYYGIELDIEAEPADPFNADGVIIWLPPGTQPGTYAIGTHEYEEGVEKITAAFTYHENGELYGFQSLDGSLQLTTTGAPYSGAVYSGSFTFTAVVVDFLGQMDPSMTITVTGNFDFQDD